MKTKMKSGFFNWNILHQPEPPASIRIECGPYTKCMAMPRTVEDAIKCYGWTAEKYKQRKEALSILIGSEKFDDDFKRHIFKRGEKEKTKQ